MLPLTTFPRISPIQHHNDLSRTWCCSGIVLAIISNLSPIETHALRTRTFCENGIGCNLQLKTWNWLCRMFVFKWSWKNIKPDFIEVTHYISANKMQWSVFPCSRKINNCYSLTRTVRFLVLKIVYYSLLTNL